MQLANSIPWRQPSSWGLLPAGRQVWELSFARTFQFERVEIEILLWLEGFLRFARMLTGAMTRDITTAMNFMANTVDEATQAPVPIGNYLAVKVGLGTAVFLLAIEFAVLWSFLNPLELLIVNPTEQPRPLSQREGILKRF